jgi:hypothetical protein
MKPGTRSLISTRHNRLTTPALFVCLLGSAAVGFAIATPLYNTLGRAVNALLSTVTLLLIGALFRLVRPINYSRRWGIAECVVVPFLWVCVLVSLAYWLIHVETANIRDCEVLQNLVRPRPL